MEFFRHCPGCGRRFHIVLIDKKEVGEEDTYGGPGPIVRARTTAAPGTIVWGTILSGSALVGETSPHIFDVKEFQYRYKCKHCGHEWTETRLQDRDVGRVDDSRIGVEKEEVLD